MIFLLLSTELLVDKYVKVYFPLLPNYQLYKILLLLSTEPLVDKSVKVNLVLQPVLQDLPDGLPDPGVAVPVPLVLRDQAGGSPEPLRQHGLQQVDGGVEPLHDAHHAVAGLHAVLGQLEGGRAADVAALSPTAAEVGQLEFNRVAQYLE